MARANTLPAAQRLPPHQRLTPYVQPTEEMLSTAVRMLRDGHFVRAICGRIGITPVTWYEWLRRGSKPDETNVMLQAWAYAIQKADAEALEAWTVKVQGLIGNSWPGWFRFAESRWPQEMLRRPGTDNSLNVSVSATITTVQVRLPPEMRDAQVQDTQVIESRQLPASTHGEDEVE